MRRTLLVLLGVSSSYAAVAEARPLPDPAPWVLPVNVFAKARPGDWTILEGEAVLNGKLVHERELVRVGKIAGGVAEVQLFEGAADREGWFLSFPVDVARGPDTNLLFDLPWIATDLQQTKASCTLGDATFPCTELTYRTPGHAVTVRMAPRVLGSGLVSFAIVTDGKPTWTMTTIGYGTARKVAWGVGPPRADLEAWDGGAKPVAQRVGSAPASPDVYEAPEAALVGVPPHVELGACKVSGDLEPRAVGKRVQAKLQAIDDCYGDAVAASAKVGGGTVALAFVVDDEGWAGDLAPTGAASAAITTCVTDAIEGLQFATTGRGASVPVTCAFTFDPGKRAPPAGKKPGKPRLLTKAHPARGGPDLRGLQRIP